MNVNSDEIIRENTERHKILDAKYDPITGEGSFTCERKPFFCKGIVDSEIMIPYWCFDNPIIAELHKEGSAKRYIHKRGLEYNEDTLNELRQIYHNERKKLDFEYWAATDCTITDLLSEREIKFVLNSAQRELLKMFYDDWFVNDEPCRYIIVKNRQNGFSTEIEMLFGWIQIYVLGNVNSIICAHVENTARVIRGMYSLMIKRMPIEHTPNYQKLTLLPYEGSNKTRVIAEVNSRISVGSAEKPDNLVGDKVTLFHASEVGLYKSTDGRTPEQLVQSINSGIQHRPHTIIVYESTARGVGNFLHKEWLRAVNGESDFKPLFVPAFKNAAYQLAIRNVRKFINSLNRYEFKLFKDGATLEHICWRREKIKEYSDIWRFMQDFPEYVDEAFLSTGHRYYPIEDTDRLRKGCMPPSFVGEIVADDVSGEKSLENMRFDESPNGCLKVWFKPDTELYSNRYVVVMDIGGTKSRGDKSVICVIDRRDMIHGGLPIVVAEWCGNIDYDILAWKSVQLATLYQGALLVIESNTFESKKISGENFESIMDEIAYYYPNLYSRVPSDRVKEGLPLVYGWHTNRKTKRIVCNHQKKVLRENMYIEVCNEAVDEHETFEEADDGSLNAREGCHDDRHITRAIGIYISYEEMPLPRKRTSNKKVVRKTKKTGISSF